ncbi:MAG: cyclase family protein [Candidatus Obscuribacterales bacterium]
MKNSRADKCRKLVLPLLLACICVHLTVNTASGSASDSKAKIVDLTHVLGPALPDFHAGNAYEYKSLFSIAKDGYADGQFSTPEHYGTHIDAPSHFFSDGQTIDQIPATKLILPCLVIDVRKEVAADQDYRLTVEKIEAFEKQHAIAPNTAVLLLTGWSQRFSKPTEYRNARENGMHFPAFSGEAADYLVNKKKVGALGLDTLSADYGQSKNYIVHKTALAKEVLLIENLSNLEQLPASGATLFLGPLRIKSGTGSPARILALVP